MRHDEDGMLTRADHSLALSVVSTLRNMSDLLANHLAVDRGAEADMVRDHLTRIDLAVGDLAGVLEQNADRRREGDA